MPKSTTPPPRNPRLIVALGRGRTGKTVFLSWLLETARRDLPLRIIDADVNNPVLSQRYPEAVVPTGMGEARREWLEEQLEAQMATRDTDERHDILLDLGGGDLLVKHWGAELALASTLEQSGIDVIAVHMLGPDKADLAYLEDLETHGIFCPQRTVLLMNSGLIGAGRDPGVEFADVVKSSVVQRVKARGGKLKFMPPLTCMNDMERCEMTFQAAALNGKGLRLFNRTRLHQWLIRSMPPMASVFSEWAPWQPADWLEGLAKERGMEFGG